MQKNQTKSLGRSHKNTNPGLLMTSCVVAWAWAIGRAQPNRYQTLWAENIYVGMWSNDVDTN